MRNGGVRNGEFWVPVQCFGDTVVEMLQDVEITYAKIIQCKITQVMYLEAKFIKT